MNFQEIKKLVKLVESSKIGRIEVEEPDFRVEIEKQLPQPVATPFEMKPVIQSTPALTGTPAYIEAAPPGEVTPPAESPQHVITSPMVGTFYAAPSPDDPAFVAAGDEITPGQVICIIEAMKVMNEIEADIHGIVRRVMAENTQPVQFDDPMFIIEPL
ncbi:MAG: acetyl-CoA carboxylase biotin carboxyl carrier protein [Candidatus Delongbacteria bacterium]|nr:acetyl-CoA carboxylase biotin carboxyl carrier protein [bacterium]MBL7032675.1 acetyl-CoA carboxylase biotin carboxyl carrier protein [Candidatus Delongbacteria bacterium]